MKTVLRFIVKGVFGVKTWEDFKMFVFLMSVLVIGVPLLMFLFHWDFGILR